jgi:hypothetical protein
MSDVGSRKEAELDAYGELGGLGSEIGDGQGRTEGRA